MNVAEGTHACVLDSVEAFERSPNTFIMLKLVTIVDENVLYVNLHGAAEHVFAWRRLLGQTFNVRVRNNVSSENKVFTETRLVQS